MYIGVLVYGLYIVQKGIRLRIKKVNVQMRNFDWYANCRIPNSKLAQLSHVKLVDIR
jgi:hypothetical protein